LNDQKTKRKSEKKKWLLGRKVGKREDLEERKKVTRNQARTQWETQCEEGGEKENMKTDRGRNTPNK